MGVEIRNYKPEDFETIKAIHEATEIDYQFPDINSPLFLVKKVLAVDGKIVMAAGMYVQCEAYLWSSKEDWGDPEQKMAAIRALDREVMEATWLQGVDQAVLYLPPGYERFGDRLTDKKYGIGFTKDRDGWVHYSKPTNGEQR